MSLCQPLNAEPEPFSKAAHPQMFLEFLTGIVHGLNKYCCPYETCPYENITAESICEKYFRLN